MSNQLQNSLLSKRNVIKALQFLVFVGVFLAAYQYFYNRSLWLDEASLGLNIVRKSFAELLLPLDYYQVAPIGFLMVEKFFVTCFGPGEYALRLFPLLSFFGSVYLFRKLSFALTGNVLLSYIATVLFSLNTSLLYYASELKQYSTEVLVCIAIVLCALQFKPEDKKSIILFSLVGVVAVWFSSTAVILLFVSGLYLFYNHGYIKPNWRVVIPVGVWVISFVLYYLLFIHGHPHTGFMRRFWSDSFIPITEGIEKLWKFFEIEGWRIYGFQLRYDKLWAIPVLISVIGIVGLMLQKRYKELYFLLSAIGVHIVLSALRLYPFTGRLILYLLPFIILIYLRGFYYGWVVVCRYVMKLPITLLSLVVLLAIYPLARHFPVEKHDVNSCIKLIADRISEDDQVYVLRSGKNQFTYYHEKDSLLVGYSIVYSKGFNFNIESSVEEIGRLDGNVWLLFGRHGNMNTPLGLRVGELIEELESDGYQILSKSEFAGSSVYLVRRDSLD